MTDQGGTVRRGLDLFAERVAALPAALDEAARAPLPTLGAIFDDGPYAITGAGGSEGPARVFSDQLARSGRPARFVPLSSFARRDPPLRPDDRLVIFSQGVSPNAKLALAHRDKAAACAIVTATAPDPSAEPETAAHALARATEAGCVVLPHGPPGEGELLVRVLGPALATLLAIRLAARLTGQRLALELVGEAVSEALDRAPEVLLGDGPSDQLCALVIAGDGGPRVHGLRWKLLEALPLGDPPVWDVLQFAHGPFQQYFDHPATLITLEHDDPVERELFDRLATLVTPRGHRLVRLVARLPDPLSWFEHDAMLDALALRQLRHGPRDLIHWPGKGCDLPLYGLDRPRD